MKRYTLVVKVAISLSDALFARADEVASRLNLNRSQLYSRALERFLETEGDDLVTAQLDALADAGADADAREAGSGVGRRLIDVGAWEW